MSMRDRALLSIPIGIATGLSVTPLQRFLEYRARQELPSNGRYLREEYLETDFYRTHPEAFTQYLVQVDQDELSSVLQ